ncbi:MAG: hypothetical protein M1813_007567 [Trichoglossum hirsutum]|nr:MAG: hypothetical protein M1813_007567 [Trichoglossum hirsutum]
MSDLLGGGPPASSGGPGRGTSNGSGRAAGPIPVQQQDPVIRGPREVLRGREARVAKQKADSEASRREEERRRNIEGGTASVGGPSAGVAGVAGGGISAGGDVPGQRRASGNVPTPASPGDRRYGDRVGGNVSRANPSASARPAAQPPATARMQEPVTPSQTTHQPGRGGTQSRRRSVDQGQPIPVQQPQYSGAPPPSQQQPPQPQTRPVAGAPPTSAQAQPIRSGPASSSQPAQAGPSTEGTSGRGPTVTSSFPHAFERWETLSSHWEGLTSYWIRRLESNREEVRREPLAQQMSRQITDLSAAGANLFHAVVELQRLRASSERKFQRWFFETRAEQERAQEVQGEMENTLRRERQQRAAALTDVAQLKKEIANSETLLEELQRELQISKEEARRAWEELGRREQEERERTISLRDGIPTLVGGVQVVPMTQGVPSRHSSVNRPTTLDDPYQGVPSQSNTRSQAEGEGIGEAPVSGAEIGDYEYSEGGRTSAADEQAYMEPGPPDPQPPPMGTYPATANSATAPSPSTRGGSSLTTRQRTSAPPGPSVPASAPESYRQPHRSQAAETSSPSTRTQLYQHPGLSIGEQGTHAEEVRSSSQLSEGYSDEEEYEMDDQGNILRDDQGNKIVYRRGQHSDDSDDYDEETEAHERAYKDRHGRGASGVDYGRGGTFAAPAPGGPGWGSYADQDPAYSGAGYGWEYGRHHHPTRLSDVQEEDERSRTSASRASVASRR